MTSKGVTVTVVDNDTGDTETKTIEPGDYVLITVDPCHMAHTNRYKNGTHVVTIKQGP